MSYIMIDVEADGPIPGDYSMICFGAVVVEEGLERTFYGRLRPISEEWVADALSVSGFSREETLDFPDPKKTMQEFESWLKGLDSDRLMFIADNNGFDWGYINWYFHHFLGKNPFGYSSTNLGSLYKGLVQDTFKNFKHLRMTEHTHDPVDDAKGNAEALLHMKKEMGLKIRFQAGTTPLFCPATGEDILTPDGALPSSVVGLWHNEVLDAPAVIHDPLVAAWNTLHSRIEKNAEGWGDFDLGSWLDGIEEGDLLAIEVHASDPMPGITWVIINMQATAAA